MIVATWNVNSIRARAERVAAWLDRQRPDVVCLQETKVQDPDFPRELLTARGYSVEVFGQKTYNGVAIAAREGLRIEGVRRGLPGEGPEADRRVITATVGGLRLIDAYVVNGQAVGSEKYAYKLAWMARLRDLVVEELRSHPALVLCGDFNVAPEDRDVHDPEGLRGSILLSDPERAALLAINAVGLEDLFRRFDQEAGQYTWWDYRAGAFPRNHGYRLDLFLGSAAAAGRCSGVRIDREERKGQGASDHAPVLADFGD